MAPIVGWLTPPPTVSVVPQVLTSVNPGMSDGTGQARKLVRVQWGSRIAGFDTAERAESMIRKACDHFQLRDSAGYILLAQRDGKSMEVSDDYLHRLADGATVVLSKIQCEGTVEERAKTQPVVQGPPFRSPSPTRARRYSRSRSRSPEVTIRVDPSPHTVISPSREHYQRPSPIRKPVIYLMPPGHISLATISVAPVPQWSFTHVYPLSATKYTDDGRQCVSWTVSADPSGMLVEKGTGLELAYLFWEAASKRGPPPSVDLTSADQSHPIDGNEYFDPANPILDPDTPTAVVLPFERLIPYLDTVLRSLTLHTTTRSEFITYWLPALSKQPYVALRFLPQRVYERAAELSVEPVPDVITRVIMLFRCVSDTEVEAWDAACARKESVDWASVVGISANAMDSNLFRVLEWGAIEVL